VHPRAVSGILPLFFLLLLPTTAAAQQSLFNVPGTVATPRGEVFVQEQLNVGARGTSNLTVDTGIAPGLEIGVNVFDVTLYDASEALAETPLSMVNGVYTLDVDPLMTVQLGTQIGVATSGGADAVELAAYGWASMRLHGGVYGDYVIGAYAGSPAYLGPGTAVGIMAGTEIPLAPHLLHLMADFVYGNNEASLGVAGLVFFLPLDFQISVGVQFPSPMSENAWGGVLELTRAPSGASDEGAAG
jgi:hypothetical protein